jgi:hypothetical protein
MIDRIVRIVIGAALVLYGWLSGSTLLMVIGLIPLATALFGFCPLYLPLGIDTGCKTDVKKEEES